MAERRLTTTLARAALALAAALALLLTVGVAPGFAGLRHPNPPVASFGRDGTSATTFEVPGSTSGEGESKMAIDQLHQRLYVVMPAGRVFGFEIPNPTTHTAVTGAGLPAHFGPAETGTTGVSQAAVAEPSGNLYIQGNVEEPAGTLNFNKFLWGFDSSGSALASFPLSLTGTPCGIAVDPEGHLWISEHEVPINSSAPYLIHEYSQTGQPLAGQIDVSASPEPCRIAFDQRSGDLYVTTDGNSSDQSIYGLFRYTAASGFHEHNRIGPSGGRDQIAVDSSRHIIYAGGIEAFNPGGGLLESFGGGNFLSSFAVDEASGAVYAMENGKVSVYEAVTTPDATTGPPSAETPTSATISGHVDPLGAGPVTECYFEWGVNTAYTGGHVPCSQGTGFSSPEDVTAELSGLAGNHTYHYRLVAANSAGANSGEDHTASTTGKPTIESLSSSAVTASSAELHAGVNPHGLDTTYRFEYGPTTAYGSSAPIPAEDIGAAQGGQAVSVAVEGLAATTYHFRVVAENQAGTTASEDQTFNFFPTTCPNASLRQQTGSEYLPDCRAYELVSPGRAGSIVYVPQEGIPATYATNPARFSFRGLFGAIAGTDPANSTVDTYVSTRTSTGWQTTRIGIPGSQLLAEEVGAGDLALDRFIDFPTTETGSFGAPHPTSVAPYVWDVEGDFLGRWPANAGLIPDGDAFEGAFQPSPDFSHLAFSSGNVAFAPGALTAAPGSAYDYDTASGTTTLISKTAAGQDIAQEPGNASSKAEFILFPGVRVESGGFPGVTSVARPAPANPAVSTDGSHILMSTSSAPENQFGSSPPTRLYMRVNDLVTYEVSKGRDVSYVGMTADGSKVFFTSPEKLTSDDEDTSTDLYMWSQATDSLTLLSKGAGATAGNTDSCAASWTAKCDVVPVKGEAYTDNSIASQSGDVYFYSPEKLLESDARPNERNIYVYRNGALHYVATGTVARIQVSPTGDHMAFISPDEVTPYKNPEAFDEMYTYDPASATVRCVSCPGAATKPSGNVEGSMSGIFMSDDGRVFFNTPDPLVPRDTDGVHDVYEFVEGRPQLITSGTSLLDTSTTGREKSGLSGVSADGANVYFATHDTLVGQDENGQFLKFYDARTGGGFPFVPPSAPCAAADECHGPGSAQPQPPPLASDQELGSSGNFAGEPSAKGKHKGKHKHRRHRSGANNSRDGKRRHAVRAGGSGR